mgnify:CR=1 FL=1
MEEEIKNQDINQKEKWETKIIQLRRVSHTRAGGKKIRFRVVLVGGDKKGKVGVAVASANDVSDAIQKCARLTEKKAIQVPLVNETIPYETKVKFKSITMILKPRKKGKGLRAGTTVKMICELAGIKNLTAKKIGKTSNKMNIALATIKALKSLRLKVK